MTSLQVETISISGLQPYTGEWNARTAAHLCRRTTFGPQRQEILRFQAQGLQLSLDELFLPASIPNPPVLPIDEGEVDVNVGDTWVNTPYTSDGRYRGWSLNCWFFNHLMDNESALQAKMTLFWINYFGMADLAVSDHRAIYSFIRLYQELSTGNFREMIERITVHPAMLEFLNGDLNNKTNPNENYARELLELFTIQKGPLAGPGDYTNYTEDDVVAIARALTGWRRYNYAFNDENVPVDSYFDAQRHDINAKQLSHRFNNAVIRNTGEREYKEVIRIILLQPETSRAFCRELYRYFVFHDIDDAVEQQVIVPMAQILVNNNYEIVPALRALLGSQHFYDMAVRGPIIKNPYEFLASIARSLGWYGHLNLDLFTRYALGARYEDHASEMGMHYLAPPTVAGWEAYYDAPRYYRNWVSPALLQKRFDIANTILYVSYGIGNTGTPFDLFEFVRTASDPRNVDNFLDEVMLIFLPREPHPEQKAALKENLLQGLPDMEWTLQCSAYLANPTDGDITRPFEVRIRRLIISITGTAEFQLH